MKKQSRQSNNSMPWIIGGVVLAAVLIVGLLVALNQSAARPATATISAKEWPQADGTALGPANAPVVLKLYSDFQCPYCKLFSDTIQPQIIDQYIKTGQARMEYHHFIVIDANVGGNESRRAAEASECAAEQGRFWDYHELLYANQQGEGSGVYKDSNLKKFASQLGLDTTRFNTCLANGAFTNKVKLDEAQAKSLAVAGTPALFVNGKLVQNPVDWNTVKAAIDAQLAAK